MKKQSIFINKIIKKMNNNQNYCAVEEDKNIKLDRENSEELNVLDKIDQLFNTNGYIFNINVTIITKFKEYHTKIASKINNYIITLDNDIISIDDIKDILIDK